MTYFRFHLIFNLPLLIALAAITSKDAWTQGEMTAFGLVLIAVLIFTTPWDNLAAKWGIWGFPREKYSVRIWHLPLEEYLFFLLQSANVMLAVRAFFYFFPDWQTNQETDLNLVLKVCLAASVLPWVLVGFALRRLRQMAGSRVNYAVHLAWFLPVIYSQWVMAFSLFSAHALMLLLITAAFGIYYMIADLFAVRAGTWFFDEKQITGLKLGGILPWEEVAFFFLTTLLVAQSYILLLPSDFR